MDGFLGFLVFAIMFIGIVAMIIAFFATGRWSDMISFGLLNIYRTEKESNRYNKEGVNFMDLQWYFWITTVYWDESLPKDERGWRYLSNSRKSFFFQNSMKRVFKNYLITQQLPPSEEA